MKKVMYLILVMFILGGCGGSSSDGEKANSIETKTDPNRVKIDSLKASLIGNAKSKYQLDNMEDNAQYTLDFS